MAIQKQTLKYIIADYITANVGWFLFNLIRYEKSAIYEGFWERHSYMTSHDVLMGQLLIPFFWLVLYYYSGYYNQAYRKSRLSELTSTLIVSLIGTVVIFFVVIVNDLPPFYELYYKLTAVLLFIHFSLTYSVRFIITQYATYQIHTGKIGFNTLVLGVENKAFSFFKELNKMPLSLGYRVIGFVRTPNEKNSIVPKDSILGSMDELDYIIKENNVKDIIIALEDSSYDNLKQFYALYKYDLPVKVLAEQENILSGNVKMTTIYGKPMFELFVAERNPIDANIKQTFDTLFSFFVLLLLAPLFLFIAIRIKLNDKNAAVFFKQERIGKGGNPFNIYKFRTMYPNAESEGPSLSGGNDSRITSVGKWMRKYRIDELPQFWNVLKGNMSIVGPRPERKYFIDKIVKKAPHYYLLYRVKPGITSWGMVKYGYAQTVDEMIDRLNYDIIYLENMSLIVDLKISIYTIRTVITGQGI